MNQNDIGDPGVDAPADRGDEIRLGYILKEKQLSTWGRDFFGYCKNAGISAHLIDFTRPIAEQGPFHVIIQKSLDFYHKYSDADSARHVAELTEYLSMHPETHMLDPLTAVDTVLLRSHLNAALSQPALERLVSAPRYLNVHTTQNVDSLMETLAANDLKFPLVYKPDHSDGTPESHECAIIFGRKGLATLKAPYILQDYIEHGGQLLKAYTIGTWIDIVVRNSLSNADLTAAEANGQDPYYFGRISRAPDPPEVKKTTRPVSPTEVNNTTLGQAPPGTPKVGDPPRDFDSPFQIVNGKPVLVNIAAQSKRSCQHLNEQEMNTLHTYVKELHRVLGLTVMGIDIIRDTRTNTLRVVDINYFPSFKGVSKSTFCRVLLSHIYDVIDARRTPETVNPR